MRVAVILLCFLPAVTSFILADLLNVGQTTFLVNSLVQAYGLDVTPQQCQQGCHGLFVEYSRDVTCDFVCTRIKVEVMRRLQYPTVLPTAAPTPAPYIPKQPTLAAGDSPFYE